MHELCVSVRCWPPDEASPVVSHSQSGVALWTLQENDGERAVVTDTVTCSHLLMLFTLKKHLINLVFVCFLLETTSSCCTLSNVLIPTRCLSPTKRLSMTCVASTLKTTLTSYRRSAPITCRASQKVSTRLMWEMTGECLFLVKYVFIEKKNLKDLMKFSQVL